LRSKLPALRPARAPFKRTLTLALYAHLAFASLAQAAAVEHGTGSVHSASPPHLTYTPGSTPLP
jgi:hypothetical protein